MEYTDLLRRLALQDERFVAEISRHESPHAAGLDQFLDPRTLALMRLAALVAVGGAVPSYGAHVDAAAPTPLRCCC